MKSYRSLLAAIYLSFFALFGMSSSTAMAAAIDAALPSNTSITLNGFDWAWGAHCSSVGFHTCDTIEFSFQATQGWTIAQTPDMALAPTALDFLFDGANVPFNGVDPVSGSSFINGGQSTLNAAYTDAQSAGACASAYFTMADGTNNCDWTNGGGQNQNTTGWFNQNGETDFFADVLFVRPSEVPLPAAAWLFISAIGGLVVAKRKQLKT